MNALKLQGSYLPVQSLRLKVGGGVFLNTH